jgi:hypothetical protein
MGMVPPWRSRLTGGSFMLGEEWLASMVPRVFKPSEELEARQFEDTFWTIQGGFD